MRFFSRLTKKEGYLVLFAGQSNMVGHRNAVGGCKPVNKDVLAWSHDGGEAAWRIANLGHSPFNTVPGQPNNPALHFADALQKATGKTVYLVGRPVNGSTMLSWSAPDAGNMAAFLKDVATALADLKTRTGRDWTADSVLWCQGESDDDGATMVKEPKVASLPDYRREFGRLIDTMRAQPWWSGGTTKVIAAELVDDGWLSARNDFYRDPSQWPGGLAMGVSSSAGLSSVGDNAHFDGASLAEIGRRMYAVRERLVAAGQQAAD